jgi:hypothetical protein
MDEGGVHIRIFSKDPGTAAKVHVFKTHTNVVSDALCSL